MSLHTGQSPNLKSPPRRRKCYQISGFTGTMMRELADGGAGNAIPKVADASDVLAECPLRVKLGKPARLNGMSVLSNSRRRPTAAACCGSRPFASPADVRLGW